MVRFEGEPSNAPATGKVAERKARALADLSEANVVRERMVRVRGQTSNQTKFKSHVEQSDAQDLNQVKMVPPERFELPTY